MESLTKNIASKIAQELNLNNDNKEVIAYGMFALIHMILSIGLVVIFGAIFDVLKEALIICFTGSALRKYSGGAHASSPSNCAIIGTVISVGQAMILLILFKYINSVIAIAVLGAMVFILSYYLLCKLAPVDSLSKPIRTENKKNKMRKGSIFILVAYIVIILVNFAFYVYTGKSNFLVFSLCIYGGTLWQCFTLTKAGHNIMNKIDSFLNKILKRS